MADPRIAAVLDRFKAAQKGRDTWESHWQSLARVFRPRRADFTTSPVPGERRADDLYDSAPMQARRQLSSTIGGILKPKEQRWFSLKPSEEGLAELDEVKPWVQTVEDRVWNAIYSRSARFLAESGAVDDDLVTFGTGILWIGTNRAANRLSFRAMPLRDAYLLVNADRQIDTIFLRLKLTARQAAQRYGAESLPKDAKEALEGRDAQPDKTFDFLWAVMPREDRDPRRRDNRNLPFASLVIDKDGEHVVNESGFHEFPFATPRWDIASGEVYGRSPAMLALPDANSLQAMGKTILKAGQKAVDPPYWATRDGLMGVPRLVPGGLTYVDGDTVRAFGGRPPIGTLFDRAHIPLGREMQNDIREQVFRAFFRDILRLPVDRPGMTATEILERRREFLEVIGPVFGQLEADYIGVIPERVFGIMLRAGALPPPPEVLQGREVRFEYQSPVARARQQADAANVARFFELMTPAIGLDPSVADNFNFDEISRDLGRSLSFKADWLRPREEVAQLRQQRAQAQALAQSLNAAQQAADVARSAGEASQAMGGVPL